MRNSNIDWYGVIPTDWKLAKVKDCFIRKKDNSYEENPVVLSLARSGVKIRDISNNEGQLAEDYSNYNHVQVGDLLLNPMDLISGDNCSISEVDGVISPAYFNLGAKEIIFSKYYHYLFKMLYWNKCLFAHGKGVSYQNRWTLNWETFSQMKILLPPKEEQIKISKYLDSELDKVSMIIKETEETIEKYKEYKQSIITEVVIGGLNKEVEKRNSGIEWIGDIPSHWKISRIKNILEWKSIKNHPEETVLSLYREYGVIPKDSRTDNHNVTSEDTSSYKLVDVGDFVVNKMKAWQGSMAVSDYRGIISPAYHICSFKKNVNINKKYFHYLLRNKVYTPEFRRLSAGIREGQWDLSFDDFKNIPYLIPPIEEQDKIVEYIDNKYKEIDILIEEKNSLIKQLEEYKKSLIYEYVTGKREIRGN